MTSFNVKFTMFVVLFAMVAGIVACNIGAAEAAARPGYLAPSFGVSSVKHSDEDRLPGLNFMWGSDANDENYQTMACDARCSSGIFSLPNTAAPHGTTTCVKADGTTVQVEAGNCDDLNGSWVKGVWTVIVSWFAK